MRFAYYSSIAKFIDEPESSILGALTKKHEHRLEEQQRNAWIAEIRLLKPILAGVEGDVVLEYSIPRMGKRIDCVILSRSVIFAVEFKIGADSYESHAIDQVTDYALDLKNFHAESHYPKIVPILLCTKADEEVAKLEFYEDGIAKVVRSNGEGLRRIIAEACVCAFDATPIDVCAWLSSGYKPTPTIIEAAQAMYRDHTVEEISRSDAGAINLSRTAQTISRIIEKSKQRREKAICFLTGVPGAGKTLAGLNLATLRRNEDESEHAVFLSGNGPLVDVLQEALARNDVATGKENGNKQRKAVVLSKAKAFIQNIHHFRDDMLADTNPPDERVVVYDEAQRAWTSKQLAAFMKVKKGREGFSESEPEFLIGVMDRHADWAVIVCLIGGGQEINTGEAGLHEWFDSLRRSFPHWSVYISDHLTDAEYTRGRALFDDGSIETVHFEEHLHLSVSIRSFRSERVAAFVKAVLDCHTERARELYGKVHRTYPIVLTRDLQRAKDWVRGQARGTERYGLLASSGAIRLRPWGLNVKSKIDPKMWFLNGKDDIRSSYFLEDVATEFDVQGLELDWTCVGWDADFRHNGSDWTFKGFTGTKWHDVNDPEARVYLKNAYRVLLTRARQGMVIFVPYGVEDDATRRAAFYDQTFGYLRSIGMVEL